MPLLCLLLCVAQVRIVTYLVMGVFKKEEMSLYGSASAAALVGVLGGAAASSRLDQVAFGRLLVGLMSTCCLLMFMSAAGVAGK